MDTIEEAIQWRREMTCFSPKEQHEFDERLRKDYDGYMGMLPEWMPDDHKKLFIYSREQEFSDNKNLGYDTEIIEAKVIEQINNWCEYHQRKRIRPRDMGKHIFNLGLLKYQSSLSKEEVIKITLGAGARKALMSFEQSKRRKNRNPDKLSQYIYQEVVKNPSLTESGLLAILITDSWIRSVTDSKIKRKESNKAKQAPMSGLKDRLHKAKKKYNSL